MSRNKTEPVFVGRQRPFDKEFTITRNEWIADSRISAEAFRLYLLLGSELVGETVGDIAVVNILSITHEVFIAAYQELITAGYLVPEPHQPGVASVSNPVTYVSVDPFEQGVTAQEEAPVE